MMRDVIFLMKYPTCVSECSMLVTTLRYNCNGKATQGITFPHVQNFNYIKVLKENMTIKYRGDALHRGCNSYFPNIQTKAEKKY